jgi:hypothetical protein
MMTSVDRGEFYTHTIEGVEFVYSVPDAMLLLEASACAGTDVERGVIKAEDAATFLSDRDLNDTAVRLASMTEHSGIAVRTSSIVSHSSLAGCVPDEFNTEHSIALIDGAHRLANCARFGCDFNVYIMLHEQALHSMIPPYVSSAITKMEQVMQRVLSGDVSSEQLDQCRDELTRAGLFS